MKRIGLTQRVAFLSDIGERRDCLDQNWARLVEEMGWVPVPLSNAVTNVNEYLNALDLDGAILTGGNDLAVLEHARDAAPERDAFESGLLNLFAQQSLPVLGVCRGAQFLATYHGGSLTRVEQHVALRHHLIVHPSRITLNTAQLTVNSYHNFGLKQEFLGPTLVGFGHASDGTVEAFEHPTLPQFGIMWHPEREKRFSQFDLSLLRGVFEGAGQ